MRCVRAGSPTDTIYYSRCRYATKILAYSRKFFHSGVIMMLFYERIFRPRSSHAGWGGVEDAEVTTLTAMTSYILTTVL